MKTPITRRHKQLGLGLVEMGIAAVVIATLLIGILVGLPRLQLDMRLNQAREAVPRTLNAMTTNFTTQVSTWGANTQILSAANVWPSERVRNMGQTNALIQGVFPGSSEHAFSNTAKTVAQAPLPNQGFTYWQHNIPREACLGLVQLLVGHRSVTDLGVADSAGRTPNGAWQGGVTRVSVFTGSTLHLNMQTATVACSRPGNKSIVAIVSRA